MNKENQKSGNSGSRTQGGSHEQHVAAGRKGGEASHSGGRSTKSNSAENSSSGSKTQGGTREQHAEAGRKGGGASRGSEKKGSQEDDESR